MMIHWGSLEYGWLFPVWVVAAVILLFRMHKKRAVARLLNANKHQLAFFSLAKVQLKTLLYIVGLFFLFIALLSPQWKRKEENVVQEGRDLLIALDISRSMLAQDIAPNRLEAAKEKIKQLINLCLCERVGLLLFSGASFLQCPLTTDYSAFLMFLNHVDVESISSGGTAIDQAIRQALTTYKSMPERKNKLLAIFTDGEDYSSNLAGLKNEAEQSGMHIFTVGIGTTEGAPIPLLDEKGSLIGHQKDERGSVVITRLNESLLKDLSEKVGGTFIKSVDHGNSDMIALWNAIQQFEKERMNEQRVSNYENQYPYFVLFSLLCFLLEWVL